jgi:tetratricopeptide (TPR) repeat protein
MRTPKLLALSLLASFLVAAPALADEKPKKKGDKTEKSSESKPGKDDKASKGASSGSDKKDPNNVTGISPFMEKLAKGHKQVVARDFPGAIETYRSAITEDDKNPLGHYYLGAAQLLKGDLAEAEASWKTALRDAGTDENTHAKVAFAIADLRERQAKIDEAKTSWVDYGKFVGEHPRAKGYPTTAGERQKVIDTHQDLQKKYGEVKKRIEAREKEQKDKQSADAAKDAAEEEKKGGKKKKLPVLPVGCFAPLPRCVGRGVFVLWQPVVACGNAQRARR